VSIHDFFPTLANLAGGGVPDDRTIDGKDQTDFFLGKTDKSARESVLFFSGDTIMAMKWRQFKIYLTGEGAGRWERKIDKLWAPEIYNLQQDPKENNDVASREIWLMEPVFKELMPFIYSVVKYGLVEPGGDKPTRFALETPYYNWTQMELSLGALKKQAIRKRISGEKTKK
jgi:arylsulfatase